MSTEPKLLRRLERSWAHFRTRARGKPDFYDEWGFPYWLWINEEAEENNGWSSWMLSSYRGELIGEVKLSWDDGEEIKLWDIVLHDDKIRGRGLGTILLQRVFAFAKDKGMKRIHGRVVLDDVERTPHLLDWYRKHGFEVTLLDDGESHEVAEIMLTVSK